MAMIRNNSFFLFLIVVVLVFSFKETSLSRQSLTGNLRTSDSISVNTGCIAVHNIGEISLTVNRANIIGGIYSEDAVDCLYRKNIIEYGAEYPIGSGIVSLESGIIMIGGIIDKDTLVSNLSFSPIVPNRYRSILDPDNKYSDSAVSEQDYISIEADNIDILSYGLPKEQQPLNVQITKKSYVWSYEYARNIVFFDIEFKNIGNITIQNTYIALHILFFIGFHLTTDFYMDDVTGFLKDYSSYNCGESVQSLNMLWGADNDGDPIDGEFVSHVVYDGNVFKKSAPNITGICFLQDYSSVSNAPKHVSYNWWTYNGLLTWEFGPQKKIGYENSNRIHFGRPRNEPELYQLMNNRELDYDLLKTLCINEIETDWQIPNQKDVDTIIIKNYPPIHLLSVGPFNLPPGGIVRIPFAYVAGENFHTDPTNGENLPHFPYNYYQNLDFSDITKNAQWARWIYDNPGVDTDGDGDSGKYMICDNDTIWYQGDGIPDWKAAGPPPAPYVWLEPTLNGIRIRFNGSRSETEKDIFTKIPDFEGYNIYIGRDEREASMSLIASYDKVNYDKFVWHPELGEHGKYIVEDIPYSIKELCCLYADSCNDESFNPLVYTRTSPMVTTDSIFYFTKHHYNSEHSTITKIYPNARDPRLVPVDEFTDDDYTEEGYFKFFEYEYTIENLLPTVGYWINVTAFDFGSPKSGLKALETSKTLGIQEAYRLSSEDELSNERLQVYVYPNPYRLDADYRDMGFEGRTEDDRPDYRVRALNFANLPTKCEIKIFSLDGDLVRHLSHDVPISDPTYRHHTWNLITRNTHMVVSGLYYWTVEFPDGEVQMGKFVVIM